MGDHFRRFGSRVLLGSLILLLPSCAFAQRRAGLSRPAMASAPRVLAAPSAPSPIRVTRTIGSRPVTVLNSRRLIAQRLPVIDVDTPLVDSIAVPGLGFDIPHFFAVHPHARFRKDDFLSGGFFPFFNSGFIVPLEPVILQAQPIVVQQPVIVQRVSQATEPEDGLENSRGAAAAKEESESKPAQGSMEYVFVRRDGGVLFAVAFMQKNDHIEYITPEGSHRTVALSALDLEATQRFNEERGVAFRLPA